LANGRPVVALESTVLTHGLPADQALAAAERVETAVREAGAVPATIAVLHGRVHIGLDAPLREQLVQGSPATKAASRDLPAVIATGVSASTTVGATCVIAARMGITVFATGGIGGVHRDASVSFDESGDLVDLARTGRIVVSAGIKSILDVGATLERLETLGVPVAAWRSDEVPGFWLRTTGFTAPSRVDHVQQVAAMDAARSALGLAERSILVLRPVDEEFALDEDQHQQWVDAGLAAAERAGLVGGAVTPFVLDHVHTASRGASVTANIALLEGNAALAARIAAAVT
jgi:pseudouridine-5'-phosphate glycosidase